MRFEYDREVGALYIYVREIAEGAVARQIELQEGVYLDADQKGRTLGMEFLDLENFREWLERGGGKVEIPKYVKDLKTPGLTPA